MDTPRIRAIHEVPDEADSGDGPALEDDLLDTPRPEASYFETPTWPGPLKGRMFGPLNPLTPSPTPKRKRALNSPSAPHPAKRTKTHSHQVREDSEDEHCTKDVQELASDRAFGNVRRLTISLAASTACPVEKTEADETEMLNKTEILSHTAPCSPQSDQADVVARGSKSLQRGQTDRAELMTVLDKGSLGLETASQQTTGSNAKANYAIAIETFSEDELEEHLSELLSAYRACYLEPDEAEPQRPKDPIIARRSRHIFKAIFENQLNSAEDEGLLLQEEEEDVLDMFITWLREMQVPFGDGSETFQDLSECLQRMGELAVAPLIKKIV
jgi:hypothetical protein